MRDYRRIDRVARPRYLCGLAMLMLLLAACGSAYQGSSGNAATPPRSDATASEATPNATPDTTPAAIPTDQPTSQPTGAAPATLQPTSPPPATTAPTKPAQPPVPPEPLNPTAVVTTTTTTPANAGAPTAAGAWKSYRDESGGYVVEYPAAWTASQQPSSTGWQVTTFAPGDGGAGVSVLVRDGDLTQPPSDIPNTRCQQVTVAGVSGTRCFDTLSFSYSTTITHGGKTYMIASSGKRIDQTIYQRFLDSFMLIS